ncbi:MAG: HPr family phosphocarrier protein [Desulfobacterales bacterium]|nr:HPr family phosphocarrier protein [Desulfobacterales bacterium]MDD4071801.1 HPr family phosphocarrier protein [Desulfobacterales bacterium]MDD4393401.1 HPr family phosphocarrier protein [Desulfobacterales bacterium]
MKTSLSENAFTEKARCFSHDFLKCCICLSKCRDPRPLFTKKFYSTFVSASQLLEDFLDIHGAKNNRNWYFYRELSAAVRQLSLASYSQRHISNRLPFYNLSDIEKIKLDGEATLLFLNRTLIKMAPVILDEARRLHIPIPEHGFDDSEFISVSTGEMLEYDIDDEDKDQQKENIIKIASDFLNIGRTFDQLAFYKPYNIDEIMALVPAKVNEVEIRRFEMLVHNLQSSFDTYVIHGGYQYGNRKMKELRSFFSVVFHLMQMMGRLLHFYERHLHDAGYKNTYKNAQEKLSALIDPHQLLFYTINYGLNYVCHFLKTGECLARQILNENIERSSIAVNIPVKLGFHCRPSLLVAKIVQHYGGQVELCFGSSRFDASSVLNIQWAGGQIQKENIKQVLFEGDVRALRDIKILAGVNYGEDTMGKGVPLPPELKYLT